MRHNLIPKPDFNDSGHEVASQEYQVRLNVRQQFVPHVSAPSEGRFPSPDYRGYPRSFAIAEIRSLCRIFSAS
jgi:hypothetical protein